MATVFDSREQEALNQSSKLRLTQALIVGIDEDKPGLYQCRVLPDLITLDRDIDCPWYPLMFNRRKEQLDLQSLAWVYVSSDLGVGFVWGKANATVDQDALNSELWFSLRDRLSEADIEASYESTFFQELYEGTYSYYNAEARATGIVTPSVIVAVQDDAVKIIGNAEVLGNVKIGEGSAAAARADELIDIVDELERHIHTTPSGPAGPPLDPSMAPLSSKLASLKRTLASELVTLD